jgi:outer membrane receptor protein involved in Fe transport
VGVYYKSDDEDLLRQYTYLDNDFTSTFTTKTTAVYAQLDSALTNKFTLTTGLRIENRTADYTNSANFNDSPSDTMIGGKAVLAYQADSNNMIYGEISRGFKAGGVNTDGTLPEDLRVFDPEYLVNYELGYKANFLNNNAYLRTAAFYMDRTKVQVKSSTSRLRQDGSSEFIIYLGNAASGVNKGVEVESGWQVNNNFELVASIGLLQTEFSDFINADGKNLAGREQAHAPNYQTNVGVNITPDDHWLINVSLDSKDSFYFSDSHDQKSSAVSLLNATVSYQTEQWQVQLWARNILNRDYATRGFYFGNDPRDGYTDKQYTQLGEPRVFGVTVDYQF